MVGACRIKMICLLSTSHGLETWGNYSSDLWVMLLTPVPILFLLERVHRRHYHPVTGGSGSQQHCPVLRK